jgi:hypothetical protein
VKYIFETYKMVGMRDHLGQWWKVTQDCVRCGECCNDCGPEWHFAQDEIVGGCKYLEEYEDSGKFLCRLRSSRPFACCCNDPHTIPEYCSVVLEKITEEEATELLLKVA